MDLRRTGVLAPLLGFLAAAGFGLACDPDYSISSFRCDPHSSDASCQDGYVCCSDDPAAIDVSDYSAALPDYGGGSGTPIFSAANNNVSHWGVCIRSNAVPPEAAVGGAHAFAGCPIPCNPTWSDSEISTVCGGWTVCCQTTELEPEDCALDNTLGDNGCYRPVTGNDITGLGGLDASAWAPGAHATHQDANGTGCNAFVAANGTGGLSQQQAEFACYRQLSVANQRGFCESAAAGACPSADPAYRDACEQMNDAEGRTGCG